MTARPLLLLALLGVACGPPPPTRTAVQARAARVDVAIIAGCPTLADGSVSPCQWERALKAATLWQDGRVRYLMPSGAAVHNRYVEAEASRLALMHLGVPDAAIALETQALHTDENASYGLQVAQALGWQTLTGVGGGGNQGYGVCMMAELFGGTCRFVAEPTRRVRRRIRDEFADGFPVLRVEPVPAEQWQTIEQRERAIAEARGEPLRPPSHVVFARLIAAGFAGRRLPPPPPPTPEPTLASVRNRLHGLTLLDPGRP